MSTWDFLPKKEKQEIDKLIEKCNEKIFNPGIDMNESYKLNSAYMEGYKAGIYAVLEVIKK